MPKFLRLFRSKWVRLPLIAWGVYIVVAAAILFSSRYRTRQQGEKEVAAVVAKLDAEEPGWKWQDIEAARGPLPGPDSTSELPLRFHVAMTNYEKSELDDVSTKLSRNPRRNRRLSDETAEDLDDYLDRTKALSTALEFQPGPGTMPRLNVPPDIVSIHLPITFDLSRAVSLLGLDAERCCRRGDATSAILRLQAMLNVERSIGSEPFALSQVNRMILAGRVAYYTERVLALVEPSQGLAELQSGLLSESHVDFASVAFRGERAALHELFLRLESGTVDLEAVVKEVNSSLRLTREDYRTRDLFENCWWFYKKHLPHNHAAMLEAMTRACTVASRPEAEHTLAMAELKASPMKPTRGNYFTRLLLLSPDFVLSRQMKKRTMMRCAATAIAVERFRLKFGHWPATLAEIPADILPSVPLDPFDGKPLKYASTGDGVEIFSIEAHNNTGFDESDPRTRGIVNADCMVRLFDPNRRGLSPPPVPLGDFPDFEFGPPGLVFGKGTRVEDDAIEPEPGPDPRIVTKDK